MQFVPVAGLLPVALDLAPFARLSAGGDKRRQTP
jgi:hypothetical protein